VPHRCVADDGATICLGIELSVRHNANIAVEKFVLKPAGVRRCVR
jgi:hypothetical protein